MDSLRAQVALFFDTLSKALATQALKTPIAFETSDISTSDGKKARCVGTICTTPAMFLISAKVVICTVEGYLDSSFAMLSTIPFNTVGSEYSVVPPNPEYYGEVLQNITATLSQITLRQLVR